MVLVQGTRCDGIGIGNDLDLLIIFLPRTYPIFIRYYPTVMLKVQYELVQNGPKIVKSGYGLVYFELVWNRL